MLHRKDVSHEIKEVYIKKKLILRKKKDKYDKTQTYS